VVESQELQHDVLALHARPSARHAEVSFFTSAVDVSGDASGVPQFVQVELQCDSKQCAPSAHMSSLEHSASSGRQLNMTHLEVESAVSHRPLLPHSASLEQYSVLSMMHSCGTLTGKSHAKNATLTVEMKHAGRRNRTLQDYREAPHAASRP
jgi:hypothetical protein